MISFPNAKINIGLNVVSKRPDGYHNLETIFYPVHLSDALEMVISDKTELTFSGLVIDGKPKENLVLKAYYLLNEDFDLPPVKFHLHKIIPFGAGLGGGSANAAFVLKMLNETCKLGLNTAQLEKYASKLGADCAFFIQNKPTFATGIGNQFHPVNLDLSAYKIVILKPDILVSTKTAYQNIVPQQPQVSLSELIKWPVNEWKNKVINDFEESVFKAFPELLGYKELLYKLDADYASMSGSGSSLFGLFRHLPTDFDSKIPEGVFIYR
ncbi:MAG: 4-(cytidine 5'-diphospho)-2-C-methyl-D-erythritol kinase [Prolixibacteraceae bacterium]|nr:4-(cytidine 5'-diphospho)-2-C-methyl-D-erythritol kinase [Prolixibacteraceae bacterium]